MLATGVGGAGGGGAAGAELDTCAGRAGAPAACGKGIAGEDGRGGGIECGKVISTGLGSTPPGAGGIGARRTVGATGGVAAGGGVGVGGAV